MINNSNQQTLKEAIQQLINSYKLGDKLCEVRLINSWEKVVGKMIANHTINLYVKKGKLYIKLDSAALKHELSFSKQKIVKLLNKEVGESVVKDVVFL